MRYADLGVADLARERGQRLFVRRKPVAMHEHDGDRTQPRRVAALQCRSGLRGVQRAQHRPLRTDALVDLLDLRVQQLGQHDLPLEQARAVLVGDAQGIAKAARDQQQGRLAFAFEQGVGGDGGAHLDRVDQTRGDSRLRLESEQMADAGHRRIAVMLGVFR